MADTQLNHIINKVENEKKIFANKSAFDTSNPPSKIISRVNEVGKIVGYILDYKQQQVVPLVSIYGRSGTGKSTLLKYVCDYIPEVKLCFTNLRKAKTVFGTINLILNQLDQPSLTSAQGMNLGLEKIRETILNTMKSKNKKLFVLALDEFDVIFYDKRGNPSDFVYKLVEMVAELKEKCCLAMIFTISNNILSDYDLDDRVRSRIGNSEIFFKPYTQEETLKILQQRSEEAFGKKIDDKVLKECARFSYLEHGDARRAVDLLRVSAEIAAKENKEISVEHIKSASKQLQKDRLGEVISSLSYHSKVITLVLAVKTYGLDDEWHTTKSIFDSYPKYLDAEPVGYRRFSELLNDLENSGLLVSKTGSKGHKGYKSEYSLVVDPEIVGELIDKEWWNENVVKPKANFDEADSLGVTSGPLFDLYKQVKKHRQSQW
ncbi:Cdc6/Cdc18 family protein [Nitrosopumilus sp.]|uniref:Cdc6/Cdc18 family protein n=1 Tax=Nitrosopumilus sp. TaxID=2024843 RepID=UPI0034A009AC